MAPQFGDTLHLPFAGVDITVERSEADPAMARLHLAYAHDGLSYTHDAQENPAAPRTADVSLGINNVEADRLWQVITHFLAEPPDFSRPPPPVLLEFGETNLANGARLSVDRLTFAGDGFTITGTGGFAQQPDAATPIGGAFEMEILGLDQRVRAVGESPTLQAGLPMLFTVRGLGDRIIGADGSIAGYRFLVEIGDDGVARLNGLDLGAVVSAVMPTYPSGPRGDDLPACPAPPLEDLRES